MRITLAVPCAAALAAVAVAAEAPAPAGIRFEQNLGQTASVYSFLGKTRGKTLFFGSAHTQIELHGRNREIASVMLSFPGSNPAARWTAAGTETGRISYFVGADSKRWVHGAPQYTRLERKDIYPGVDLLVYDGGEGRVEYDLVLAPNADPARIRLRLDSQWSARPDTDGSIEIRTPAGTLTQRIPAIYQIKDGKRQIVRGQFRPIKAGSPEFRLELATYDRKLPLIVDPVIENTRYFGGELDDEVVTVTGQYVAGNTTSVDFLGVIGNRRGRDIFVQIFNSASQPPTTGQSYFVFGGSDDDEITASVASSLSGIGPAFYIAGVTKSRDLPSTRVDPLLATRYGGGASDGMIMILRNVGPLFPPAVDSIYVGGSGEDRVESAVLWNTQLHVTGVTDSPDLPVRAAFQPTPGGGKDAFVAGYSMFGGLIYSSYVGGAGDDGGHSIAAPNTTQGADIYVGGYTGSDSFPVAPISTGQRSGASDGFLISYSPTATQTLRRSHLIGGSGSDAIRAIGTLGQEPGSIVLNTQILLAGTTNSSDFPLLNAAQTRLGGGVDAFAMSYVLADGSNTFSTYLGGTGDEEPAAAGIRANQQFLIAGSTNSNDFPVKDPAQARAGGGWDGFLSAFSESGVLTSSTYFGGSSDDRVRGMFAADYGNTQLAGSTNSPDLPGVRGLRKDEQIDGFTVSIGIPELLVQPQIAAAKGGVFGAAVQFSQTPSGPITVRTLDPSKVRIWTGQALVNEMTLEPTEVAMQVGALAESGEAEVEVSSPGFPPKRVKVAFYPAVLNRSAIAERYNLWSTGPRLVFSYCAWNQAQNRIVVCSGTAIEQPRAEWVSSAPNVISIPGSTLQFLERGTAEISLKSDLPVVPSSAVTVTVTGVIPNQPGRMLLAKDTQALLPELAAGFPPAGGGNVRVRLSDSSKFVLLRSGEPVGTDFTFRTPTSISIAGLAEEGETTVTASSSDWDSDVSFIVELRPLYLRFENREGLVGSQVFIGGSFAITNDPFPDRRAARLGSAAPIRFRITSSNAAVATPRKDEVITGAGSSIPAFVIDCKDEGQAAMSFQALDPPGFEVRGPVTVTCTRPDAPTLTGVPTVIRTSKDLVATYSTGFLQTSAEGPYRYTIGDGSLAQISINESDTPQTELTLSRPESSIRLTGLATSGSTELTIRSRDHVLAVIRVELTPAALGFTATQVRVALNDPRPSVGIAIFGIDPTTGIAYGPIKPRAGVQFEARYQVQGDGAVELNPSIVVLDSRSAADNLAMTLLKKGTSVFTLDPTPGLDLYTRRSRMEVTVVDSSLRLVTTKVIQNGQIPAQIPGDARFSSPIRVESTDPTRVLLSSQPDGPESASLDVLPGRIFYLIGLASSGSSTIRLSGAGFESVESTVTHAPLTAVLLDNLGHPNTGVEIQLGTPPSRLQINLSASRLRRNFSPSFILESSAPEIVVPEQSQFTGSTVNLIAKAPGTAILTVRGPEGVEILRDRVSVTVRRSRLAVFGPNGLLRSSSGAMGMSGAVTLMHELGLQFQDTIFARITSLDPSKVLLSQTYEGPQTPSVSIPIAANQSSSDNLYLHILDSSGVAEVRLTADGYDETVFLISLRPARVDWSELPREFRLNQIRSVNLILQPEGLTTRLNPALPPLQIPVRVEPANAATLSPATVPLEGLRVSPAVEVKAQRIGTFEVIADLPQGVVTRDGSAGPAKFTGRALGQSFLVRCTQPFRVGRDLSAPCAISVPSGKSFTATSSNPSILTVSTNVSAVGAASATGVGDSGNNAIVFAHALAGEGQADITLRADGFEDLTFRVFLVPSVLVFGGNVSVGSAPIALTSPLRFQVQVGIANEIVPGFSFDLRLRPGAPGLRFELANSNPAVIGVEPSVLTIGPGEYQREFTVSPVGPGSAALRITPPNGFAVSSPSTLLFEVEVKALPFQLAWDLRDYPVPRGLSTFIRNSLPASNVPITVTSSDPSLLLIASGTGTGAESVSITDSNLESFRVIAVASAGTAEVILTSPGYLTQRFPVSVGPVTLILRDLESPLLRTVAASLQTKRVVQVVMAGFDRNGGVNPNFDRYVRYRNEAIPVALIASGTGVVRLPSAPFSIIEGAIANAFELQVTGSGSSTIRATATGFAVTPAAWDLTYNVAAPPPMLQVSCASPTVPLTTFTAVDMVSNECRNTTNSAAAITATVEDPSVAHISFDDGRVGPAATAVQPRILQVHGLKVGQTSFVISAPGFPNVTGLVNVRQGFAYISEPANGTLTVNAGQDGVIKTQLRLSQGPDIPPFPIGTHLVRPGVAFVAVPVSQVGNQLTIVGQGGGTSEVRIFPGQDAGEFRVRGAVSGSTTLRIGTPANFVAPQAGFRTEMLVTVR